MSGGGGGSVGNGTAVFLSIDRQLIYAQVDQQLEESINCNSSRSAELVQTALETLKQHEATVSVRSKCCDLMF